MRLDYFTGKNGPSGFGSSSTADDVTAGVDLSGKVAVVTGAGGGLGAESARVLALRGAHVIIAVRNTKSGQEQKEKILAKTPNAQVDVMELDLSSFASVRSFSESFKQKGLGLNILLNNAGVMACPFMLSKDGHELQFATNHLGHFLLTKELLPVLKETASKAGSNSHIVNVASMAHAHAYKGGIRFDLIDDEKSYKSFAAYGQSKLANVLHAKELSRRFQEEGVTNVTANALCPGGIKTNLQRHVGPGSVINAIMVPMTPFLKSIPQGAATSCYLAANPSVESVTGKYFYDCNEGTPKRSEASDVELAKKLWDFSEKLVTASS